MLPELNFFHLSVSNSNHFMFKLLLLLYLNNQLKQKQTNFY
jgi:hypothetical protein